MVYQGSKTKYAKYIVPILQKLINDNNIETFIDGMCGGCNIIDKIKCNEKIALDINNNLIELYNIAVYHPELFNPPEIVTKEMFYDAKTNPSKYYNWEIALFSIFASFNCKGFIGGYCAISGNRNRYDEKLRNFKKQIPLLQNVKFLAASIFDINPKDAVIYLDPPYAGTTGYDTSKNFNHDEFWKKVRKLSENNIVIVSEQQAPEDFDIIWELETKRTIKGINKYTYERLFRLNN